jgi:pimeloyl-ACP methyl ester carboxylesterase
VNPMRLLPPPWSSRRILVAAAAGGGLLAGGLLQRRHLYSLAADPVLRELSVPLVGRRHRVVSADGTALNALEVGASGAPTVVLAHGWTEQLEYWGPVIRRLEARGLRLVAYDLRGHGRSEAAVDSDYSLPRFGEDVEAVLAQLGHPDATVVGHSLGAMSIVAWAQHHDVSRRARAAALVNTGLGDLLAGHLLLGELATLLNHPWTSRLAMGARVPVPPFSTPAQQALIRYAAFGPDAGRGEVAFYERMLIACQADARAAVGVALSDMDLWDAVNRLTIPTLVVTGEADKLTPPAHAERIARELPHCAGLIRLPRTGHMSPLERPDELADALARLARDPQGAADTSSPAMA